MNWLLKPHERLRSNSISASGHIFTAKTALQKIDTASHDSMCAIYVYSLQVNHNI